MKSAMPMFEARRLCPHASVVRPDMEKYARVGREVRALMLKLTPLVEPVSIDEAFMDVTGSRKLFGEGETIGRAVKVAVHGRETPEALSDAADVVVDGPAGLVTLLRGL